MEDATVTGAPRDPDSNRDPLVPFYGGPILEMTFLDAEIVRDVGDYEIVITQKPSHWLGFNVYRVIGRLENGTRVYNRDGYKSSPDPVEDRASAQVFMSGSIKWDGCSDITIDDEPLHFCGRDHMEEFKRVLSAIYDLASELILSYEGG